MRSGLALAAKSPTAMAEAVWMVKVDEAALLRRWFPLDRRIGYSKIGDAEYFRTADGMSVCLRGEIAALTRKTGADSLFGGVLPLMAGRAGRPLAQSPSFRELLTMIPPRPLSVICLSTPAPKRSDGRDSGHWLPKSDRMLLGLYEGRGRLDLVFRARLSEPQAKARLSPEAVDRIVKLPSTTLVAYVTTVDFEGALESAVGAQSSGILARYLTLLASMPEGDQKARAEGNLLGPHIVLAWDQDFRIGRSGPQVAILLECEDEVASLLRVRQAATNLIQLISAIEPARAANGLSVVDRKHLGATVSSVSLHDYAAKSRLPFMQLLANTEPSWTVWKGWLMLAMSREHIERIIDADVGLIPPLETVPDVQLLPRGPAGRAALSIAQADLAARVMNQWLEDRAAGSPSLLNPSWWQGRQQGTQDLPPRLGIGMKVAQEPGVVVVARVYPNTAAEGRLQPEDRIVGIDGRLLSLGTPNADLRRGWVESTTDPGPTVRVLRDGTAVDVVLPKRMAQETDLLAELRANPADAIRELAALAKNVQFASFSITATDPDHYSAQLSIRFTPPSKSKSLRDR